MRSLWLLVLLACVGLAETTIALPQVGAVRDPAGRLHGVYGVRGALVLGPPGNLVAGDAPAFVRLEERTLIRRRRDGSEQRIVLPGAPEGTLQRIGRGWLAAWPFAIHLAADRVEVYRLPAEAPR